MNTQRGVLGYIVRTDIVINLFLVMVAFCAMPLISYATIDPDNQESATLPPPLR
jgi:hypothetical protein